MKELSIEDKAKLYDKAVIEFKPIYDLAKEQGRTIDVEEFERIFPEFKESEDERIKNEMITYLSTVEDKELIPYESWIAWLEKQGECHISHDDKIMIEQLTEYFTTGHGLQNTNETVVAWLNDVKEKLEKQGEQDTDISSFPEEQQVFMRKYTDLDKITLIKLLAERDANNAEIIESFEKQGEQKPLDYENERIRKEIIALIEWSKSYAASGITTDGAKDMITWLEKIGEHLKFCKTIQIGDKVTRNESGVLVNMSQLDRIANPRKIQNDLLSCDKIEPKFKVGNWITDGNITIQIEAIKNNCYLYCGDCALYSTKTADKVYHLWTIQDAKDGDLIYVSTEEKGIQAIFHEYKNETIFFHCYLYGDFAQGGYMPIGNVELVYPLQEIHYKRFFEKMHEAEYEWDAEKKELKKIEQKSFARHKVGDIIYYNSFGKLVRFVIANIVEDGTDNPMYEDKDGNYVFQNNIVEERIFRIVTKEEL